MCVCVCVCVCVVCVGAERAAHVCAERRHNAAAARHVRVDACAFRLRIALVVRYRIYAPHRRVGRMESIFATLELMCSMRKTDIFLQYVSPHGSKDWNNPYRMAAVQSFRPFAAKLKPLVQTVQGQRRLNLDDQDRLQVNANEYMKCLLLTIVSWCLARRRMTHRHRSAPIGRRCAHMRSRTSGNERSTPRSPSARRTARRGCTFTLPTSPGCNATA
jgi:hypothetical protein